MKNLVKLLLSFLPSYWAIMEANFRQSLVMSQGSFLIFFVYIGITFGIAALLHISTIVPFVSGSTKYQEFR
jgi:TctA family transporter